MTNVLDRHFAPLQAALDLRGYRQQLLAANMANADTPNYHAVDLKFADAMRGALSGQGASLALQTDQAGQQQPAVQADPAAAFVAFQSGGSVRLDGNSVDMNREQSAFASNSIQYEADLTFITGKIKNLLAAITAP